MQKFQTGKKILTFLLTICMILPLISNQYLVVRANEDAGETAIKTLADLAAAGDYDEVDMTSGENVTLTNLTFSENANQYVVSNGDYRQTYTAPGRLFKITLRAKQSINVYLLYEQEDGSSYQNFNSIVLYEDTDFDNSIYESTTNGIYSNKTNEDKIIYAYVINEDNVSLNFTCEISVCNNIANIEDKAMSISGDLTAEMNKQSENYVSNIAIENGSILFDAWIFKNTTGNTEYELSLPEAQTDQYYYVIYNAELDKISGSDNWLSCEDFEREIRLPENGYILISKTSEESDKIKFTKKDSLSNLEITTLTLDEVHNGNSQDKKMQFGNEEYYTYHIALKPDECVSIEAETVKNNDINFKIYDENRDEIEYDYRFGKPKTSVFGDKAITYYLITNDTAKTINYYIALDIDNDADISDYSIKYGTPKKIDQFASNAIILSEGESESLDGEDARRFICCDGEWLTACALFNIKIPANTIYNIYVSASADDFRSFVVYDSTFSIIDTGIETGEIINASNDEKDFYVGITDSYNNQVKTISVEQSSRKIIEYKNVDAQPLQIGKNNSIKKEQIIKFIGDNYVQYVKGWLFSFKSTDESMYAMRVSCPEDSDYKYKLRFLTPSDDDFVNSAYTNINFSSQKPSVVFSLENNRDYYMALSIYTEYGQEITDFAEAEKVNLEIVQNPPDFSSLASSAEEISENQLIQTKYDDLQVVKKESYISQMKMYEISLPSNYSMDIHLSDAMRLYSFKDDNFIQENEIYTDESSEDYHYILTVENESNQEKKFYLAVDAGNVKIKSGQKKEMQNSTSIDSADIEKLDLGEKVLTSSMQQKISYEQNNENYTKYGNWLKVSVPEGEIYTVESSVHKQCDMILKYDESHSLQYYFSTNNPDITILTEGEYYILYQIDEDNFPVTIKLNKSEKIQNLKKDAVTISEEDIQKECFEILNSNTMYAFLIGESYNVSYGNLAKITVPSKVKYKINGDAMTAYYYDEDFNDTPVLENNTDQPKNFYIWFEFSGEKINVNINSNTFASSFATAEPLELNKSTYYRYDPEDESYDEELNDVNQGKNFFYAKMYSIKKSGKFTLNMTSSADNSDAVIYIFERGIVIDELRFSDFSSNTIDTDIYVDEGCENYVLVCGDSQRLNSRIDLTLKESTNDRTVSANDDEADELIVGSNKLLSSTEKKQYIYFSYSDDKKNQSTLRSHLYKLRIPSKHVIRYSTSNFDGYAYIVNQDSEYIRQIYNSKNDGNTYEIYKNESEEDQTLYLLTNIYSDSDLMIEDVTDVPLINDIHLSVEGKDAGNIVVGDSFDISVQIDPVNADNKELKWVCYDSDIAEVDEKGHVTTHAAGQAVIYAYAKDGSAKYGIIILTIREKTCNHSNTEIRNKKEATYTEKGYTGDLYCKDCGELLETGKAIDKLPQPVIKKPATVTNVKASPAGKNKVKITWNQVSDADGYLIYAKKNGTYAYCGLVTSKTKTYYTDTKAQDVDYNFYWVYAYKFDANNKRVVGACEHYTYAKGTCLRVENLKSTSLKGGVKISWSKSAGADGYIIYGKTKSGKYGYIGMTSKTTYTHTKASKSEYNFYWVFPYHNSTSGKRAIGPISAKYVYGKAK